MSVDAPRREWRQTMRDSTNAAVGRPPAAAGDAWITAAWIAAPGIAADGSKHCCRGADAPAEPPESLTGTACGGGV